ncbi:hypothetical protein [Paenibacillus germinis]|uniref:hypothetical protein n=1 Tax=Paenibacillus germinis TaxID=2654979 RepID=UPI0014926962|nr:hypothetical protein [Paenibacillus germinis]
MTAQGVSKEELSSLLLKNDEVSHGSLANLSYIPRSKKKRMTNPFFQKLFRYWRK